MSWQNLDFDSDLPAKLFMFYKSIRGSLCCQSCPICPQLSSSPWWCAASLLLSRNIWLHSSHGERLLEAHPCLLQHCLPSIPSEHLRCTPINSCAFHLRRSWIPHSWQLTLLSKSPACVPFCTHCSLQSCFSTLHLTLNPSPLAKNFGI